MSPQEIGNVTCDDGLCTGGHYNPSKKPHGSPSSEERHVGDLGNIQADKVGPAEWQDYFLCHLTWTYGDLHRRDLHRNKPNSAGRKDQRLSR